MAKPASGGAGGSGGRGRAVAPEPVSIEPVNGEFRDTAHMNAYIADQYNRLTDNAKAQVDKYQATMYINDRLRRGTKLDPEERNHLNGLTAALSTTQSDMVVYRGAGKLRQIARLNNNGVLIGGEIGDKAFMSTSIAPGVGAKFARYYNKSDSGRPPTETTVFKINVPKGSKGFFPNPNDPDLGGDQEITFNRGSKLRVTKAKHDWLTNRWEIEADLIQ